MMKNNTFWDHFLSLTWVYILIFPTGNIFNISIPILFLVLFNIKNKTNIMMPLFVFLMVTLLLNLGQSYMWFKGISRLITMAVIFITFSSFKGSRIYFPYILFALLYIIGSQISYMYNISFLTSIFDQYYNVADKVSDIYQMDLGDVTMADVSAGRRFGGIYINPNNCASFVSLIYAIGLCELNYENASKRNIYIFVALVALSFLLTGSRTSFIVFSIITVLFLKNKGIGVSKFVVLGLAILILLSQVDIGGFRAFKVGEGMDNSFGVKMFYLGKYLETCDNPIHFLFGCGDITATSVLYHSPLEGTDFDLGNIFITFGIFFYILYIAFYFKLYKTFSKGDRIILVVLLWSLSNSILISFRMCPVWFISLGVLYKRALMAKKEKNLIKSSQNK